ncbi:60S ribosomal protein L13 [Cyclospora cayetanensis]|uniref:60S ribosomal protein L13 n=1 Tax=Cyclospora cayetanensis TaxID=88456 RepID=A0A6P6RSW6_9EIME|nr:60S ribosomal protein L13 [Cyclospora cayetanensis]
MVSRSAQLPNTHLRKEWQRYVRTWFNQPARKQKRRLARQQKAAKNGIRPVGLLRPVVHCPTQKYNMKVREGRGFTLEELQAVNISRRVALSMGIAVDHRRRNKSQESVIANINRLKLYLSKLVLFQRGSKAKKGCAGVPADTPKSQIQNVKQTAMATALPIEQPHRKIRARVITEEEKKFLAYATLRRQLRNAKTVGKQAKRLAEKAAAEAAKK